MSSRAPIGVARRRFNTINGFSDQAELPRIAKLRLGIVVKEAGKKDHPRETDHFVLDVEESVAPEAAGEIRERFAALYGDRPQVLTNVRLIGADRERAFSSAYEWWRAGKLACHGNGDEALRKIDGQWQDWTASHPCANGGCPDFGEKKCGLISRLRVMLPEVSIAGFFQIDTGSVYSAANIRNGLNLVAALTTQAFGEPRIHAIPLTLVRAPQKIEYEGKLNEHFILHLQPQNYTLDSLMKQLGDGSRLLTAGTPVIAEDEDDLPEDLIPENEHHDVEAEDPALTSRIESGFAMLEINAGTQAALRARFPRQADLVAELARLWSEKKQTARRTA